MYVLLFARLYNLPKACCNEGAYEGTYDEDPNVCKSFATSKDSGTDRTGGVHACAGEVDAYQVDENQRETDGEACEVVGRAVCLVRRTKHYEHEESRQDNLDGESRAPASVAASAYAVCTKTRAGIEIEQRSTCDDGTDDLAADVAEAVLHADATSNEAAKRDGRIDVATGDAANGVGHSNYGETEGNGGADNSSDATFRSSTTKTHGCTATEERQYECTD